MAFLGTYSFLVPFPTTAHGAPQHVLSSNFSTRFLRPSSRTPQLRSSFPLEYRLSYPYHQLITTNHPKKWSESTSRLRNHITSPPYFTAPALFNSIESHQQYKETYRVLLVETSHPVIKNFYTNTGFPHPLRMTEENFCTTMDEEWPNPPPCWDNHVLRGEKLSHQPGLWIYTTHRYRSVSRSLDGR